MGNGRFPFQFPKSYRAVFASAGGSSPSLSSISPGRQPEMLTDEGSGRFKGRFGFRHRARLEDVPHTLVDLHLDILTGRRQGVVQPYTGAEENALRAVGDQSGREAFAEICIQG